MLERAVPQVSSLQEFYHSLTASPRSMFAFDCEYTWMDRIVSRSQDVSILLDGDTLHEGLDGGEASDLLEGYTEGGDNVGDLVFRPGVRRGRDGDIGYQADMEVSAEYDFGEETVETVADLTVEGEFQFSDYLP